MMNMIVSNVHLKKVSNSVFFMKDTSLLQIAAAASYFHKQNVDTDHAIHDDDGPW